jgi:hypothetical protein
MPIRFPSVLRFRRPENFIECDAHWQVWRTANANAGAILFDAFPG